MLCCRLLEILKQTRPDWSKIIKKNEKKKKKNHILQFKYNSIFFISKPLYSINNS